MSPAVNTLFYVREKTWHGLGTKIMEAPASKDALIHAGLDWIVRQRNIYTEDGQLIPGYKVNTRSTDNATLGIVSDRYKVVQNEDAFRFTDDLLGEGATYEATGALQGGKKVWMLVRMPQQYYHRWRQDRSLHGSDELPRRELRNQGCHDACSRRMSEHIEFGPK